MSTEETNGFSAPNEDANVAGADSTESAPVGQVPENNHTAPGADDAAQAFHCNVTCKIPVLDIHNRISFFILLWKTVEKNAV